MPDVSVVIVNWNTRDLLIQAIRTTLATTVQYSVEIVLVDNGSSDGSVQTASAIAGVRTICNPTNQGFAAANNLGIRACTGRYICLINSDIIVLDGCIDAMCRYMDQHQEIGLLGPRVLNKDLTHQPSCTELPSLRNALAQALALDRLFPQAAWARSRFMAARHPVTTGDVDVLSGCFLMTRRAALNEVGLLDERFFMYREDVDWCRRFRGTCWKVRFYPAATVIHLGGCSSSVAPATFLIEMERANLQYWNKYASPSVCFAARAIAVFHYFLRLMAYSAIVAPPRSRARAMLMAGRYTSCLRWLLSPHGVHAQTGLLRCGDSQSRPGAAR